MEVAREVCERRGCALVEADGESDHLHHLLIDYPPKVSLSNLIGLIKTNTSKRLREKCWPEVHQVLLDDHFWSPSYFVASTGGGSLAQIAAYKRVDIALDLNGVSARGVRPGDISAWPRAARNNKTAQ